MKYAWIDEHRDQYSVTRMCRQLEVLAYGIWPVENAPTQ